MDGFINSKIEKQTIYEIYRACRLCGAGAGYKMPINQNAVKLDGAEVELKQKIRECVQIEVHQDDKMPPLICELCVDKVNDFYEFLEMCRHTNKRTRLRLGLPPQTMPSGAPDAGDCILGVTEPVFLNDDSTSRLRSKSSKSSRNSKSDNKSMATSNNLSRRDDKRNESRSLRSKQPSPPRLRGSRRYHDEDEKLSNLQKSKRTAEAMPKSILKKQKDAKNDDDNSYLSPRLKRPRDRDSAKKEIQNKKVKIQERPQPHALRSTRTSPSARRKSPPPAHNCTACKAKFDNYRSLHNHMRIHALKQADRKQNKKDSKDVKCTDCRKSFSSKTLLNIHRCPKQGGDCNKCNKHFYSQKSLIQHKRSCVQKRQDVYIHPNIRRILKQLQIRVARCDPILKNVSGDHYDVSNVEQVFGLDENCLYPYKSVGSTRIKFEPGYMVDINDDIKEALDADKYVHWDSDDTDSDVELTDEHRKKVDSLVSLSLRTIYSNKFLGKVPKKRRKVKAEKAFDSILNVSDFDTDLKRGIDNIIDSLDDQIDESMNKGLANKTGDSDSLFGDDNAPTVTNDDFDSLFNNNKDISKTDTVEDNLCKDTSKESEKLPSIEDSEEKDQIIKDNIIEEVKVKEESSEEPDNTDIAIADEYTEKSVEESKESLELRSNVLLEADIERNYLEIEKSKDIENIAEESSQIIDSDKVVNDSVLSATSELTKNENTVSGTYDDDNIDEVKKARETIENESNEYKASNTETEETREELREAEDIKESHVNGETVLEKKSTMDDFEDLSDADIDDKRLMAALDAQIGETETADAKSERESHNKDKIEDNSIKSDDLESISDDDFNLND